MKIVPKIQIQHDKTDQFNVVVQDRTGAFSSGNPAGYGHPNPVSQDEIKKYIFVLKNLVTNDAYTQINGDTVGDPDEVINPVLSTIPYGENVSISPDREDEYTFSDGIYQLETFILDITEFDGTGEVGQSIITNCPSASGIRDNYDAIYVNGKLYNIVTATSSNLMLDTEIAEGFESFQCCLVCREKFIQKHQYVERLNEALTGLATTCSEDKEALINSLAEAQSLLWGAEENMKKGRYSKAIELFNLSNFVLNKCKC